MNSREQKKPKANQENFLVAFSFRFKVFNVKIENEQKKINVVKIGIYSFSVKKNHSDLNDTL